MGQRQAACRLCTLEVSLCAAHQGKVQGAGTPCGSMGDSPVGRKVRKVNVALCGGVRPAQHTRCRVVRGGHPEPVLPAEQAAMVAQGKKGMSRCSTRSMPSTRCPQHGQLAQHAQHGQHAQRTCRRMCTPSSPSMQRGRSTGQRSGCAPAAWKGMGRMAHFILQLHMVLKRRAFARTRRQAVSTATSLLAPLSR